ncbi:MULTISPECIES: amino acid ABC transporter permease [unclassified Pseudodesulfovibrio]|uniref:amino acid ABC transporter permease n=1 Tax=unclassified Pseudodesulfovibrio TaxID=2661612 RepID=UPI000FEC06FB|nr:MULTISPECIES: amino acid ABC transporter permease [unclassified Pseudodesulfovibrio]MCJ2163735.1 amino acid ABC transporter permease [Pseudodesulfovibrio sp. S3-i]RWU06011.1 amino acid ABC transporter permease [Pseudodesulfovibrio sp. S3]
MPAKLPPTKTGPFSVSACVDTAKFVVLLTALAGLLVMGSHRLGYNWQWYRIPQYLWHSTDEGFTWGLLMQGLGVTFQISAISLILMLAIGMTTALLRMTRSWAAWGVARVYMELIRNTPLLIQIFFIYFVLAPILDMSGFWAAIIALSLFEGAYASEIFRAGITSIDTGQWEAAKSLGMSPFAMYRHIILPQAVRRVLPPLTSQAVSLIKDSALVSTIAILDLTQQGRMIDAETFLTFEIWFTVAAIYLVVTLTLSGVVRLLEQRFNGIQP